MNPGDNQLEIALSVMGTQTVSYYRTTGRTKNANNQYIPVYADPVTIDGSLQPVARSKYELYGLDLSKEYFTYYTLTDVIGLQRDTSGDKFVFDGKEYKCQDPNKWIKVDGWVGILCVLVGPST